MRKYIIIVIIMLISIGFIGYNSFQWSKIAREVKRNIHIETLSYQLEISNEKQKLLLTSLQIENNYDHVVKHTKKLNIKAEELKEAIINSKNKKLLVLLESIEVKRSKLEYIVEDIKTDNAEVKNSLIWLSKIYTNYLDNIDGLSAIDLRMMKHIFQILDMSKHGDIVDLCKIPEDIKDNLPDLLRRHLKTLRNENRALSKLKQELIQNDISPDLEDINSYVDNRMIELQEEAGTIIKFLLISIVFLILFGLLVYIKEVQVTLRAANLKNELQQFVDALNESSIVSKSDLEGNITYVNDKFCEISGYEREELIGKQHSIIRHPDNPSSIFKELWHTIENKKIFRARLKNLNKNGDTYYVDTVVIPMVDIKNEILEYLAVRYDVSELIESRDEAIIAEKAKDEFLSNMSHELRTPLNAISGFSTILKREVEDEKHTMYLQNIIDSSDNLIGLIGDILDLSKLQSGKFTLDYHDFNMLEKLDQFLIRFDAQLELLELDMKKDLDASIDVSFNGDWLRISQIITNLISNALKFTAKGGEIAIGCRYEDGDLKLVVRDNGIGMSQEVQDKIFRPFEQADTSTTRKYGGTGLGLSIAFNLVEQMDGYIELTSKENEGSTFEISIPLTVSAIEETQDQGEAAKDERQELSGHLLIAEDNKTNQMLIGILVEEFGLSYDMANDGVEAVKMFGKNKYDLVLMDENMPNMNGTQAVQEIHKLYGKTTAIVALTANVMSGDREKFLEAGMDGYVAKPIDESELYKVLNSFLDSKA